MNAKKWREKKIEEILNKPNPTETEISFLLVWANHYGYEKLKKWCEEKWNSIRKK